MKKIFFILFFLAGVIVFTFAQDKSIADRKVKLRQYFSALQIYNQLYASTPDDKELNFNMGVCYFYLNNFDKAEEHFLKSSSSVSLELFRYKAAIAHVKMKFKKATNFYNAYKLIAGKKEYSNDYISNEVAKVKYAESEIANQRNVIIQNLVEINDNGFDFAPHIIADDSKLIYCSASFKDNFDAEGEPQSLIYSISKDNNNWSSPTLLKNTINTDNQNHVVGLSVDGQTIFLEIDGDIYQSKMGLDDWETPIKLDENINSKYNESGVTITLDDKVMYFVSDRPGGFGGKDIYKVIRLPNGAWSKALNLGPIVNSSYDEETPFIHTDKKTLYFSSKGHKNLGGYDIFKTTLEDRMWSEPQNLGFPVNTVGDELYYNTVASGKVAYVSGWRPEGKGAIDIYKIVLKDEFQQFHVLKAVVKTKNTPLIAKITLIDNETKKVHGIYKPNPETGRFIMLVDPEKTYGIVIEADNYQTYNSQLQFDVNKGETLEYELQSK